MNYKNSFIQNRAVFVNRSPNLPSDGRNESEGKNKETQNTLSVKERAQSVLNDARTKIQDLSKDKKTAEVKKQIDNLKMAIIFLENFINSFDDKRSKVSAGVFSNISNYLGRSGFNDLKERIDALKKTALIDAKIKEMEKSGLNEILSINDDCALVYIAAEKNLVLVKKNGDEYETLTYTPESLNDVEFKDLHIVKGGALSNYREMMKVVKKHSDGVVRENRIAVGHKTEEHLYAREALSTARSIMSQYINNPLIIRASFDGGLSEKNIANDLALLFSRRRVDFSKLPDGFKMSLTSFPEDDSENSLHLKGNNKPRLDLSDAHYGDEATDYFKIDLVVNDGKGSLQVTRRRLFSSDDKNQYINTRTFALNETVVDDNKQRLVASEEKANDNKGDTRNV